jgi:hypothetical protein
MLVGTTEAALTKRGSNAGVPLMVNLRQVTRCNLHNATDDTVKAMPADSVLARKRQYERRERDRVCRDPPSHPVR